jgi:NAD-dependent deacetylase
MRFAACRRQSVVASELTAPGKQRSGGRNRRAAAARGVPLRRRAGAMRRFGRLRFPTTPAIIKASVNQAREWLERASSVAVLTGAGISAESGIPTFRGPGGLWREFKPEQLATLDAFRADPRLVWEWYDWRRSRVASAQPNPGHLALAELERRKPRFTLITQNVDGLHDRAGSRRILKLHGDIWNVRCTTCHAERRDTRVPLPELPPRCECGGLLRPGVVWFGEMLPDEVWEEAERAARTAAVFLVVGTSAVVYPAAGLIPLAKSCGARVIECNMEETPFSAEVDRSFRGPAGTVLPELMAALIK